MKLPICIIVMNGESRVCVTVISGPMFAGKSTKLIKRAQKARAKGIAVLMIKFKGDTRYNAESREEGVSLVVSHDDLTHPAQAVSALSEISDNMIAEASKIFVDEGQFFPDLMDFIHRVCQSGGQTKSLDISGLDYNHKREHFGQMYEASCTADVEIRLTSSCADCKGEHGPAIYTRMDIADESLRRADIVVGGAETYTPVCAHCYM